MHFFKDFRRTNRIGEVNKIKSEEFTTYTFLHIISVKLIDQ